MDEETKAILRSIAEEIKERNRLTVESAARSEERLKVIADRSQAPQAIPDFKRITDTTEKLNSVIQERSEARTTERKQFEAELLGELRRLNANFESFLETASSSSGPSLVL